MGKISEANGILDKLNELSKLRHVDSFLRAMTYVGLRDVERAFEWLEKSYQERSHWLVFLAVDPKLDLLRSEPRYEELVHLIGLS